MFVGRTDPVNAALPGTGNQGQGTTGIAQDFDTFLSLLTAQLQNQDPLEPTDSSEFTRQIVSFAGIEQQLRTNENLDDIRDSLAHNSRVAGVNYLGKQALVEGDLVNHDGEGGLWEYGFLDTVEDVTLEVTDLDGDLVYTQSGQTIPGLHVFEWEGTTTDGSPVEPGVYQLRVIGRDIDGLSVRANVYTAGKITALDNEAEEPTFTVGPQNVTDDEILRLLSEDTI